MHAAVVSEHRRERTELLQGGFGPWVLVFDDLDRALARGIRRGDREQLRGSARLALFGLALALDREDVLFLSRDVVEIDEVLGRLAHHEPAERVEQAVPIHPVVDGRIAA